MVGKLIQKTVLALSVFFLFGCQKASVVQDPDFIIFNNTKAVAFTQKDDKLTKLGQVAKLKGARAPRGDYIVDTDKAVYGKTTEDNSPGKPLLYRFDKAKQTFKTINDGDAYTMSFDGTFLYRTEVYTDRVVFHKHDENLKEVAEKEYQTGNDALFTNGIQTIGDKLYILVGSVSKDGGTPVNRLWVMDKDLNKLNQIDIDYTDQDRGGYLGMVKVANTFYITVPNSGRQENGEPGPNKTIVSYNVETKELGTIRLDTPYPFSIFYDKDRNILAVCHYTFYVEDAKWTFIDLNDNSQRTVSLAKGMGQDASFTQHNGDYYFLFKDRLVKYNYDQEKQTEYDLKQYGIEDASVLVFEK